MPDSHLVKVSYRCSACARPVCCRELSPRSVPKVDGAPHEGGVGGARADIRPDGRDRQRPSRARTRPHGTLRVSAANAVITTRHCRHARQGRFDSREHCPELADSSRLSKPLTQPMVLVLPSASARRSDLVISGQLVRQSPSGPSPPSRTKHLKLAVSFVISAGANLVYSLLSFHLAPRGSPPQRPNSARRGTVSRNPILFFYKYMVIHPVQHTQTLVRYCVA